MKREPRIATHPLAASATQPVLYRINVAEAKLGVSRSTIYRLVKDGQLDLVKIGKRSSGITAASIQAMIERSLGSR
ncbi:helix-turn-helix transcriptional regulator [Chitinolyticbacter meiyuanensis]|uniref:helix-turn-helix transcriptional regulator n=1 Tax=Chitinolyticbacter meiyuanensis TaxID=682798 RepID=UPI0011E5D8B9|nr:helix-turn-helix domain-containing protein [Chitinolyticbacter meiyuanensis]